MKAAEVVRNVVKEKLARDEVVASMTVRLTRGVEIARMARTAGFDMIYVDLEHSTLSLDVTCQICLAALSCGITPMARVPANTPEYIQRVLDGGALGIIAPGIGSADEARAVVHATKFAPQGERGAGGALPPVEQIAATIAALGVGDRDHAVIVADDFGATARVYWTFKVLGHKNVSILDGGWKGWVARHNPVDTATVATRHAARFTPPGETVRVRAHAASDGIVITVADAGPGMSPDLQTRLFEPFGQFDTPDATPDRGAAEDRFHGAGLGLYVCRALIVAHGGALTLHSLPGEGTTARLVLPAARLLPPDATPTVPETPP